VKSFFLWSLFVGFVFGGQIEFKSYVGYEYKAYLKNVQKNRLNANNALSFESEIKYSKENFTTYAKLDALKDLEEEQRDYFRFRELYFTYAFENADFYLGKRILFFGSLEAHNLVNILNPQNYQRDFLSDYKEGAYVGGLSYYFEDESKINLLLKGFEQKVRFPSRNSPYYIFGQNSYDDTLHFTTKHQKPSFLGVYSKTYDSLISADVAYGIFYGFDNNIIYEKKADKYRPFLFRSLKFFTYDTLVLDAILLKFEASYTKIKNDAQLNLSNFYETGVGIEYTIERIYQNHNLGFIAEYYKSDSLFSTFDNDVFFALRYSLNDKDSSEFLGGIIKDLNANEISAYLKYSGRLTDTLNVSADIRYLKNVGFFEDHLRFGCEIKYYF